MANINNDDKIKLLFKQLKIIHKSALNNVSVTEYDLEDAYKSSIVNNNNNNNNNLNNNNNNHRNRNNHLECIFDKTSLLWIISLLLCILIATPIVNNGFKYILGVRCFIPNNYLIWEATRPISDCSFCKDLYKPIILKNVTREEFMPYAYSSKPIIIKNSIKHWPATKLLNYTYLKDLYEKTPGALDNINDDCQFLHFKSNFTTLRDVFKMTDDRANYKSGQTPWYVGWSNCNPLILKELRKLYPKPHFLPIDAEMPNTDFIFLGYEQGAIMHLDYIPRLMWQAQLQGNKSWVLAPTPECDDQCNSFSFYVEPGDAVLVDTRVWYHGTYIRNGQFSLTIQSEYG